MNAPGSTSDNYLLRCFVLIDLKVGKLTHQDIGQMESYVRMFDVHARPEGDNLPRRVVGRRLRLPETIAAFEELFAHPNAMPLDAPWIERYRQRRTIQRPIVEAADVEWEAPQAPVVPNEVQQAALRALEDTRIAGNHAGLVVLATGLGKTWLSAFDTSRPGFRKGSTLLG